MSCWPSVSMSSGESWIGRGEQACDASGRADVGGWDGLGSRWRPCRSCRWRSTWRRARSGATQSEESRLVDGRSAAMARRGLYGGPVCLRQPAPRTSQPGARAGRAQPERVGRRLRRAGDPDLAGTLALAVRRRSPRVAFLAGWWPFGAMGAFRLPPVDNLLRAIPVLGVTDNRRLTLWVAFGLTMLGGIGLDQLGESRPARARLDRGMDRRRRSASGHAGLAIPAFEPSLRARAFAHYDRAAVSTPGADPAAYRHAPSGRCEGPGVSAAHLRPGGGSSSASWPRWRSSCGGRADVHAGSRPRCSG